MRKLSLGTDGWPQQSVARRVGHLALVSAAAFCSLDCDDERLVVASDEGGEAGNTAAGGAQAATGAGAAGGSSTTGGAVSVSMASGAGAAGGSLSGSGGSTAGGSGQGATTGTTVPDPVPTVPELEFLPIALPNANGVTDFGFLPGASDELIVLEHRGTVIHYQVGADDNLTELGRATITDLFFAAGCGLLSLAFDPQFVDNRFIYISRCEQQTVSKIARFTLDAIEELPQTEVDILSVQAAVAAEDWHRFGSIGFEPDGETMWALLGDLFLRELAQDPLQQAGSLLRFLPNREPGGSGYVPAADNAFADASQGDPSIYATGFRSPWRATRDRFGRFWVGDVGLVTHEEVNLVLEAGQNFGWDAYEGPCLSDCAEVTNPLTYYGRASDEPYVIDDPRTEPATKRAVWVGEAYHSPRDQYYGLFDDAVMFGDFFTGWVRRLEVDAEAELVSDELVGHLTQVTSWKTGPDGFMYVLTLPGVLYRAVQVVE